MYSQSAISETYRNRQRQTRGRLGVYPWSLPLESTLESTPSTLESTPSTLESTPNLRAWVLDFRKESMRIRSKSSKSTVSRKYYLNLGKDSVTAPGIAGEEPFIIAETYGWITGGVSIFGFVLVLVQSGEVMQLKWLIARSAGNASPAHALATILVAERADGSTEVASAIFTRRKKSIEVNVSLVLLSIMLRYLCSRKDHPLASWRNRRRIRCSGAHSRGTYTRTGHRPCYKCSGTQLFQLCCSHSLSSKWNGSKTLIEIRGKHGSKGDRGYMLHWGKCKW